MSLDLNVYTKKGTLRKRKPKKDRNYFTADTDLAIREWLNEEDDSTREKIYRERIHYAFFKLTENIIHTYKYYYTDNHSIEEVQHDVMIFLLERLSKFNPDKGKAYSYFGTIAKRYLIYSNDKNYKKLKQHLDVDDIKDDDEKIAHQLIVDEQATPDISNFMDVYIRYVETYMSKYFPKEKEQLTADAVLELFRKRENLDIFNKKIFYIFIREMVDVDTAVITKVIKKMKVLYSNLYNQYLDTGVVQKPL